MGDYNMNEIKKKLEHLKYLHDKRVKHIQDIEKRIKAPNETIATLQHQLDRLDNKVQKSRPWILYPALIVAGIMGFAADAIASSAVMALMGIIVATMVGVTILYLPNIIMHKKTKKLKEAIAVEREKCASYIQKLQEHLEYAKADAENRAEMIQAFEAEKSRLQQEAWANYIPSTADIIPFQAIEDEYKGKQKAIGKMLKNTTDTQQ